MNFIHYYKIVVYCLIILSFIGGSFDFPLKSFQLITNYFSITIIIMFVNRFIDYNFEFILSINSYLFHIVLI